MEQRRDIIIETLAEKYYDFLCSLKYDDFLYMKGVHEGKSKFLANLHIYLATKDLPIGWNDKRYATDFVTKSALDKLKNNSVEGLEYEHLVPKKKYIQDLCEQKAKEGVLTKEFIRKILKQYLWTATVTKEEHKLLPRRIMPANWDEINISARYDYAGIDLLIHKREYLKVFL